MGKDRLPKEKIDEILAMPGQVRGVVFATDKEYVLLKWGKEGLEKLKNKAKEWGVKTPYEKVEVIDWYPAGQRAISLLLIREVFNLDNSGIRDMGSMAPKFSFIVKLFFKLFSPIEKFAKEIPGYWDEHFTEGELEVIKVSEKDKELIIHLKNVDIHPIYCVYSEGYFERVIKFIYPTAVCKETKCAYKGDDVHEYRFTWE